LSPKSELPPGNDKIPGTLSNGENFDLQKKKKKFDPQQSFKKVKSAEFPRIRRRVVALLKIKGLFCLG